MCQFASFVLTKNDFFYGPTDSHEDIIKHHNLRDEADRILLVRIELTPPLDDPTCQDYSWWNFRVDQDQYPEWSFAGDPTLESRAREALLRRANAEKWFVEETGQQVIGGYGCKLIGGKEAFVAGWNRSTVTGGYKSTVIGGDFSTVAGGDCSTLIGGKRSTLTGGDESTVNGGDCSTATGGRGARVIGGYNSTVTGGDKSTVIGAYESNVVGGDDSKVIGGDYSTVRGGKGSVLIVEYWDGNRRRIIIGYVGEDGIEANVPYIVKKGKVVRAE